MAKRLESDDPERVRFVETCAEFQRRAHAIRPPSCVRILERPLKEIQKHLGLGLVPLVSHMHVYLTAGGELARVDEARENYRESWAYHYDLRPQFSGRVIYIETRFLDSPNLDDRFISIVSVHPPRDVTWSSWMQC